MSKTIGILKGKQAKWNQPIIKWLWTNQPLTAWQLTGKIRSSGKVSLHATLNKSLRRLEKKGYVLRKGKLWILDFKGMITYLIIQPNPKPLSPEFVKMVTGRGLPTVNGWPVLVYIKDISTMIRLANLAKDLMKEGVIDFDTIKNRTLATLLITQDKDNWLDKILEPKKEGKEV